MHGESEEPRRGGKGLSIGTNARTLLLDTSVSACGLVMGRSLSRASLLRGCIPATLKQ